MKIDEEARTVEVAFSSDTPYERWFGNEILMHGSDNVDLARLKSNGPLLVDHNSSDHVGVIKEVWLDADNVARAKVKFSRSARGTEIFNDVIDGVRTGVSVGYQILSAYEEKSEGSIPDVYVDKWMPFEISITSIPADFEKAGVGRYHKPEKAFVMKDEVKDNAAVAKAQADAVKVAVANATKDELIRARSINEMGDSFKMREAAQSAIQDGVSVSDFQARVMDKLKTDPAHFAPVVPAEQEGQKLGMDEREIKSFSIFNMVRAMANPHDKKAQDDAAFERECSSEYARQLGKAPKGMFIPFDVLDSSHQKREVTVGAGTGDQLVANNLLAGSFIDLLRNKMPLVRDGHVKMMSGLVGDVSIPKLLTGAAAYWVGESAAATTSDPTFGQIAMTPKTISANTEMSRKFLMQSTPNGESIIRNELAQRMALGLHQALINGPGTGNAPTGLMNATGLGITGIGTNGGVLTWDLIVGLLRDIEVDDAEDGSLILLTNPKVKAQLMTTKVDAGSGIFLSDKTPYPLFATNQVPSNLTKGTASAICSALILGSFRENLMLGLWSGLDVIVDPYSKSSEAVTKIVMHQDADVAVREVKAFQAITDILA